MLSRVKGKASRTSGLVDLFLLWSERINLDIVPTWSLELNVSARSLRAPCSSKRVAEQKLLLLSRRGLNRYRYCAIQNNTPHGETLRNFYTSKGNLGRAAAERLARASALIGFDPTATACLCPNGNTLTLPTENAFIMFFKSLATQ